MKVIKLSEISIKGTSHKVESRLLYDNDSAQTTHIKLKAGECLKPHITLEGTPKIMIGDEKQTVQADCLVERPKNIPHCIYNNSDKIVSVLVVKSPKPKSKTIFYKNLIFIN